jgi:hypothetical protein
MNRIEIQLDAWESAPCPICTKLVNLDAAEQLLYQAMTQDYGYSDDDIRRLSDSETETYESNKWSERLCKEEEAVVIECGGVYYEDMGENPDPTIYEAIQQIKLREQEELKDAVRKYGKSTSTGYEYRFEDDSPVVAAYSKDEPCDIVILSVMLKDDVLSLYASEKDFYNPRQYPADEVFAGYLDYVTSDLLARNRKVA